MAERIRKLEERGVITGYAARVDAARLGKDITAFIGVAVNHPKYFAGFAERVLALPDVLECHRVAGQDSYLLKVKTDNNLLARSPAGGPDPHHPGCDPHAHHHRVVVDQGIEPRACGPRVGARPHAHTPANALKEPTMDAAEVRPIALARRMSRMKASAVREILKVAERPDILSFARRAARARAVPRRGHRRRARRGAGGLGPRRAAVRRHRGLPCRCASGLAERLATRGVPASVDRLLVTTGSQQGIDLVAKILLDPGDLVAVENPSYLAALQVFAGYEVDFAAVGSDDDGMRVEELEALVARRMPKLIYLVTDFHKPQGHVAVDGAAPGAGGAGGAPPHPHPRG